jgi:alpha-1,2-mannosyltransferase
MRPAEPGHAGSHGEHTSQAGHAVTHLAEPAHQECAPGAQAHEGLLPAACRRAARWGLPVFLALYAVSAAVCCALAWRSRIPFVDMHVYRMGGHAALHGSSLYSLLFHGLPFTYPPFAAVALSAVAPLPWAAAATLVTVASVVTLPVMLYLALRLPPAGSWLDQPATWRLALAAAALAIWLEPVRSALGYGQIDLFLAAGVVYDLTLPDASRRKGAVIGLAGGLKLTPAIFVAYLLLTRRFRAAAAAAAVFAATIAIGFAVMPASSARYWDGMFLNPGHISPVQDPANQSLLGAMSRTLHSPHVTHVWLPTAILVALAGLALAAGAQRRGDEAAGFCLCAITGLLVSPISWTHHWVIAVPALLIAAVAVYRNRTSRRPARILGAACLATLAIVGWGRLARLVHGNHWLHLSAFGIADSEIYVIAGLATLALAACLALANRRMPDPGARPTLR